MSLAMMAPNYYKRYGEARYLAADTIGAAGAATYGAAGAAM